MTFKIRKKIRVCKNECNDLWDIIDDLVSWLDDLQIAGRDITKLRITLETYEKLKTKRR